MRVAQLNRRWGAETGTGDLRPDIPGPRPPQAVSGHRIRVHSSAPHAQPTITHTSSKRTGYPLVLWVLPSHTNTEPFTRTDIPARGAANCGPRARSGDLRQVVVGRDLIPQVSAHQFLSQLPTVT